MNFVVLLQVTIIFILILIVTVFHIHAKKRLDMDYLFLVISAVLTGGAIYEGIMWVLKPTKLIVDRTVYSSPLYNVLVGFILIVFSIIAIKEEIKKFK